VSCAAAARSYFVCTIVNTMYVLLEVITLSYTQSSLIVASDWHANSFRVDPPRASTQVVKFASTGATLSRYTSAGEVGEPYVTTCGIVRDQQVSVDQALSTRRGSPLSCAEHSGACYIPLNYRVHI
jgi:hypothetical protein